MYLSKTKRQILNIWLLNANLGRFWKELSEDKSLEEAVKMAKAMELATANGCAYKRKRDGWSK